MKTAIILFIVGLIMSPVIGLAQTSNTQVPPTASVISPQTTAVSSAPIKCGVNTFVVNNDCGIDAFKSAYVQCYDGYETTFGDATSCKSSETWQQYAKDVCVNRCSTEKEPNVTPKSLPAPTPGPKPISACHIRDNLMREYDRLILEMQRARYTKEGLEEITQKIIALKQEIEKQQRECANAPKPTAISVSAPLTPPTAISGSLSITESVRPVVVESGQEISAYYKTRLEKVASTKGTEKQIEELKILRDEIDGFISNLIKSRKELEIGELNNLVTEVKVSRGEIKADNIVVKTTEKKMLVNVGDRPVSIEPTANQVLIRDQGLEVKTDEVTIKENVLSVGGAEVKMSASEVMEKLGLMAKTIELKEENAKAVYSMKIEERRKLFGFIPFNIQKTVAADAENGQVLTEHLPWYGFLTTK